MGKSAWRQAKEVMQKFLKDQCLVDASALSYVTVLSLVPLIVVTFSFFSAFTSLAMVKGKLLNYLLKFMVPGSASAVVNYITSFSAKAKTIGLGGLLAFFSLAFSLFSSAEQSLSKIWKVKKTRSFINRLFVFTNILFWVPLLLGSSFYISTKVAFVPYLGGLTKLYFIIFPIFISWIAFTFFLFIVPPCKVKIQAAMIGGGVASILWELAKHGFDLFVTHALSIKAFLVLYGSLVIFPVFLIWIYLCWTITLLGAEAAYIIQYKGVWEDAKPCVSGFTTAILLLTRVAKGFIKGKGALPVEELAHGIGLETTRNIMNALENLGFVTETEQGYLLSKPPETIFLKDMIGLFQPSSMEKESIKDLLKPLEDAMGKKTLLNLIKESDSSPS